MKKLLLILLFPLLVIGQTNDCNFRKNTVDFLEFNTGTFLLDNKNNPICPSVSFMFGSTFYVKKKLFFDLSFGVGMPFIGTIKTGIGTILGKNFEISIGVRPYPSHFYFQLTPPTKKGRLLISFESSPLSFTTNPRTYLNGNSPNNKLHYLYSLNIGYRYTTNKKIKP